MDQMDEFVKHLSNETLPDGYRLATVEEILKHRDVIEDQSLVHEGETVRLKNGYLELISEHLEVRKRFLLSGSSHKLGFKCASQGKVEIQLSQDDYLIALLYACEADDILEIEAVIKDARPQILKAASEDTNGCTALHYCAYYGWLKALELLLTLSEGVAVDLKDNDGDTVLNCAASAGQARALEMLVVVDWVKELINQRNNGGETALKRGSAEACAVLLAVDGVIEFINERNNGGATALMLAAGSGSAEACSVLLGIDSVSVDLKDNDGDTVLHWAALGGNVEAFPALLKVDGVRELINKPNHDGKTALWLASRWSGIDPGSYEFAKKLIEHPDIRIDMTDRRGETALHVACREGDEKIVELLLKKSASLATIRDFAGETALHEAARAGRPNVVKNLLGLEKSLNDLLDQRDKDGRTALHWAAAATPPSLMDFVQEKARLEVVKLLLKHADTHGYKPLLLWASAGPILGTANTCTHFQSVRRELELEMKRSAEQMAKEGCGKRKSLLQMAVHLRQFGMARELINRGADTAGIPDKEWNNLIQTICPRASDQPALEDTLGRIHLARGIAALLLNPFTGTPITVGIFGPWGTGKSSIMLQVEVSLLMTSIQRNLLKSRPSEKFPGAREYEFTRYAKRLRLHVSKLNEVSTLEVDTILEDTMKSGAHDNIQRLNQNMGVTWLASLRRKLVFWQCRVEPSQEEDQERNIGKFLSEYRQEHHHELLKGLAIADRSKLVHGPKKSGPVSGEIPAVLTMRYNAWLYQGQVEALAGLAVQIMKEMEACLTTAQWLRMCCNYAWKRQHDYIFVQLFLPLIVCVVLGGWIAWLVWKLLSLHNGTALAGFKYGSVPVSVLVISWIILTNIVRVIQPVSQQLLNFTSSRGHEAKLGYQQQIIDDIDFLKREMCTTPTFFWNLLRWWWPTPFFQNRDYIPGTRIPKLTPPSNTRIFVFIDDLDRCNEENYVLQMVSAVNMILAVCKINVVLGVDRGMIEGAIKNKFKNDGNGDLVKNQSEQDGNGDLAEKFLEKIIQVPVDLPEPSEKEMRGFLDEQLGNLPHKSNGSHAASEDHQRKARGARDGADTAATISGDLAIPIDNQVNEEAVETNAGIERVTNDETSGGIERVTNDERNDGIERVSKDGIERMKGPDSPPTTESRLGSPHAIEFPVLISSYTDSEREVFNYLLPRASKYPRECKRLLNYHRLAWNIVSQSQTKGMMDVMNLFGWQEQLAVWVFVCWEWKNHMNEIIENWPKLLSDRSQKWNVKQKTSTKEGNAEEGRGKRGKGKRGKGKAAPSLCTIIELQVMQNWPSWRWPEETKKGEDPDQIEGKKEQEKDGALHTNLEVGQEGGKEAKEIEKPSQQDENLESWKRLRYTLSDNEFKYDVRMDAIQAFQNFRFHCKRGHLKWPLSQPVG